MTIRQRFFATAAISLLTLSPGAALDDARQVLTGGGSMAQNSINYTSPGNQIYSSTEFNNKGARAAEILMPPGTLSGLRVRAVLPNMSESGSFSLTVLKNGVPTSLTCSIFGAGNCTSPGPVAFAANDRLSIHLTNTFTDLNTGNFAFSYSVLFD